MYPIVRRRLQMNVIIRLDNGSGVASQRPTEEKIWLNQNMVSSELTIIPSHSQKVTKPFRSFKSFGN